MNKHIEVLEISPISCISRCRTWDANSFHMDELDVDERECAMGFCMSTIVVPNLSKGTDTKVDFRANHAPLIASHGS
jgi:hypothetical protein